MNFPIQLEFGGRLPAKTAVGARFLDLARLSIEAGIVLEPHEAKKLALGKKSVDREFEQFTFDDNPHDNGR